MSGITIYLSVTGLSPEDRHELSDRLVKASGNKVQDVGGDGGMGQSDIDFATELTDPEEVMKLAAFLWQQVGPLTGGDVEVFNVSVSTGVQR